LTHKWLKSKAVYRYAKEAEKNQKKTLKEIEAINWTKRRLLLKYAINNIEYYKKIFALHNIKESDFDNPQIWYRIPFLTKKIIRENFDGLKSPTISASSSYAISTGGSTGHPLTVLHDSTFPIAILGWRMLRWWGLSPTTSVGKLWRGQGGQKNSARNWRAKLKEHLPGMAVRSISLDASLMDSQSMSIFVKQWNDEQPSLLSGYIGAISALASYVYENSIEIHKPTAIWGTSAPISKVQRNTIERVFQAPLFDQYGSCEVFWLAAECRKHTGLHMFQDYRHIEFIDEEDEECKTGEYGRIAVTDLVNYEFPLIKYLNGDIGRKLTSQCTCGINLPLMDYVKGRETDNLKLKDGGIISGEYITTIFDDHAQSVEVFQVVQEADYSIKVFVVFDKDCTSIKEIISNVREELLQKTRDQVPLIFEVVNQILSDRGKQQYIISKIK